MPTSHTSKPSRLTSDPNWANVEAYPSPPAIGFPPVGIAAIREATSPAILAICNLSALVKSPLATSALLAAFEESPTLFAFIELSMFLFSTFP